MFAKSIIVSLFLAATARAQLGISTPSELKQCEEAVFTVTGANGATLYPFVVDAAKPCEDALAEPEPFTGDFKYIPKLPVGTSVMIAIEDDEEHEAWSGALTIVEGDSDACLTSATTSPSKSGSGSTPENTLGVDAPENAVDAPVVDGNSASRLASGGFSVVAAIVAFSALAL